MDSTSGLVAVGAELLVSAAACVGSSAGRHVEPQAASAPAYEAEPQLEIWLASCLDEDASRAFQLSASIDLEGALDRGCLDRAVQELVRRHDALRMTSSPEGDVQRIASALAVEVGELDLSGLEDADSGGICYTGPQTEGTRACR